MVEVDPIGVIFNDSMPLQAAHMVVAAYLVGGFLVASVYAAGMLRGRRDRYHHLGFVIAFSVAAIATPIQMGVGDSPARWVYNNQPVKFAAIELVPRPAATSPRPSWAASTRTAPSPAVSHPRPGLRGCPTPARAGRPSSRAWTPCPRTNGRPSARPTPSISPGTSWSAWGPAVPAVGVVRGQLGLPAPDAGEQVVPGAAACAGVLGVITMEAGWVVTEVGRQPWIVYNHMKVEDAATGNTGVWITFLAVVVLYAAVGTTTILVLRGMAGASAGPRASTSTRSRTDPASRPPRRPRPRRSRSGEHRRRRGAAPCRGGLRVVFGGADFGAGFWDLTVGGAERGRRPRRAIERSIGPVWEANHVWLIFIFVLVTGFSEAYASITLTLFVPSPSRPSASSCAAPASPSGRSSPPPVSAGSSAAGSPSPRCWCPTAWAPSPAPSSGRVPAGGQAGDPVDSWINPTSVLGGVLAVAAVAYLSAVYPIWDARRAEDLEMTAYFRRRAMAAAVAAAVVAAGGVLVLRADARYLFDGLTSRALPVVILSVICGAGALVLLVRDAARGARVLAAVAVAAASSAPGAWRSGLPAAGEPDGSAAASPHLAP